MIRVSCWNCGKKPQRTRSRGLVACSDACVDAYRAGKVTRRLAMTLYDMAHVNGFGWLSLRDWANRLVNSPVQPAPGMHGAMRGLERLKADCLRLGIPVTFRLIKAKAYVYSQLISDHFTHVGTSHVHLTPELKAWAINVMDAWDTYHGVDVGLDPIALEREIRTDMRRAWLEKRARQLQQPQQESVAA